MQVFYQPSRLRGQVNVDMFAYQPPEVRRRTLVDAYDWAEGSIKHQEPEPWHRSSFATGSSVYPFVTPRVRCPLSRFHEEGRCIVGRGLAGCVKAGVDEFWGIRRSLVFAIAARLIIHCRDLHSQCGLMEVRELNKVVYETFGLILKIGAMSSRAHIAWDALPRHIMRRSWKTVDHELKTCLVRVVGTFRSIYGRLAEIADKLNETGRRLRSEAARSKVAVCARAEPEPAAQLEARQAEPRRTPVAAGTSSVETTVRAARRRPNRFFYQPRTEESVMTTRATLPQAARQPWRPRDGL